MNRPVAIQSPIIEGAAVELAATSRIFRKQVLRPGRINYKGKALEFTDAYLDGLVTTFGENPYPMVPLVFADAQNRHTQDVERIRGEVIGLERTPDGLDAIVRASNDAAATLLRENPKIGCSVRIEPDLERADGKRWDAALHHVLATANPVMPGLGDWAAVELSATERTVIDLSAYDFADDGDDPDAGDTDSADDTQEDEMADAPSHQLTEAEVTRMRAILAEFDNDAADAGDGYTGPTEDEMAAIAEQLLSEGDTDTADVAAGEPVAVGLSHEDTQAIELANSRADRMEIELATLRAERAADQYTLLSRNLAEQHGIPPHVTELAKDLLTGSHVVELANGDEINPGEIVANVMIELAKAKLVDLSAAPTAWDTPATAATGDADRQSWAAEYLKDNGLLG